MSEDVKPYGAPRSDAVKDPRRPSPDDLRAVIGRLNMSQRGAARAIGIDERTMRYYLAGAQPVPVAVFYALLYLERLELDRANGLVDLQTAGGPMAEELTVIHHADGSVLVKRGADTLARFQVRQKPDRTAVFRVTSTTEGGAFREQFDEVPMPFQRYALAVKSGESLQGAPGREQFDFDLLRVM